MITIHDWSREVVLGGWAWVTFSLPNTLLRPVVMLRFDLIGDGFEGYEITARDGEDLAGVTGMRVRTRLAGTFSAHVAARDSVGCFDESRLTRPVLVHAQ